MGKVRRYYDAHFNELSDDKKFHYATRLKKFSYLNQNKPTIPISEILKNNDYTHVNFLEQRKPYFERYSNLFAIEAALVRINHVLNLYNEDLREDFKKEIDIGALYEIVDQLSMDDDAIKTLSTYAINVISLTGFLFPCQNQKNQFRTIAEKSLEYQGEPILLAYLYTHIIICATDFYYHQISDENFEIMKKILQKTRRIIGTYYEKITMDLKLEFLVCANILDVNEQELRNKIRLECNEILKNNPYIVDFRKPARLNTINGAEHRNILYIMSGLDQE